VEKTKNLFWSYGIDGAEISGMAAILGTLSTAIFGGWDKPLRLLLILIGADFILGFLAAAKEGKVNSKVMLWGGVNKLLVLLLVAVGAALDTALPIAEPYVRTGVIFFYCGREGLSLIENYGKMGLPLPDFLIGILEQIRNDHRKK
ncbi:MAG: phage holin family protein, partial [Oscillospiraceae bacterium]